MDLTPRVCVALGSWCLWLAMVKFSYLAMLWHNAWKPIKLYFLWNGNVDSSNLSGSTWCMFSLNCYCFICKLFSFKCNKFHLSLQFSSSSIYIWQDVSKLWTVYCIRIVFIYQVYARNKIQRAPCLKKKSSSTYTSCVYYYFRPIKVAL